MKLLVVLACILCCTYADKRKRYDGFKVISLSAKSTEQLDLVKSLQSDNELDFWQYSGRINQEIKIMIPPHKFLPIARRLTTAGITFKIVTHNVQTKVDAEFKRLNARLFDPSTQAFNIDDFNTYDDIMSWLDSTASSCGGGLTCSTYSIGQSYEGRDLKMFKLSSGGSGKPAYFLDSAIHAREWLSPATNLKILNHLITGYPSNDQVKNLVDQFDWYFLIIVNPDGYIYTWTTERYWRKNRKPTDEPGCVGTDLNRNYATQRWGVDGASSDRCSDLYAGPSAGSELETIATSNEYKRLGSRTKALVSFHSFVKMWLHQYGYGDSEGACFRASDHDDLVRVANAAADATQETYNQDYWQRGNICETIYPAAGGSIDYSKDAAGIKYGFGVELRGDDFVIDKSEIEPSFQETWNGLIAMINAIG